MAERYLTTGDAAALLGMSAETVRRWCATGRVAGARRPGGWWQVPISFVRANRRPASEPAWTAVEAPPAPVVSVKRTKPTG